MKVLIVALSFFVLSACATNTGDKASLSNVEKERVMAKLEDEESMVCRREKPIGSNMVKRRCITKEQYEKERAESQERARELRRDSNILNTLGNDTQ